MVQMNLWRGDIGADPFLKEAPPSYLLRCDIREFSPLGGNSAWRELVGTFSESRVKNGKVDSAFQKLAVERVIPLLIFFFY